MQSRMHAHRRPTLRALGLAGLLALHVGDDDRIAIDSAVTTLAPLRNPAGGAALDVLQVRGFVYEARYRMRFLYAPMRGQCVLMGQEILELARL